MTVDVAQECPETDVEWALAREKYYGNPRNASESASSPDDLHKILDTIEADVLPRLSKHRDVEEMSILNELERLTAESSQRLKDISEREDVVRSLFKEYRDLKGVFVQHRKREIAKAPVWTGSERADAGNKARPAWLSGHKWRDDRTKQEFVPSQTVGSEHSVSKWGGHTYSSGWGHAKQAQPTEAIVEEDAFEPRWASKSKDASSISDRYKSYDEKKWWETRDSAGASQSWSNTYERGTNKSYWNNDWNYQKPEDCAHSSDDGWNKRWDKSLDSKEWAQTSSYWDKEAHSSNRSSSVDFESKKLHISHPLPSQPAASVEEKESLPPHLLNRLKKRSEKSIPPPPRSSPSLRVDNSGWGYSGAFQ